MKQKDMNLVNVIVEEVVENHGFTVIGVGQQGANLVYTISEGVKPEQVVKWIQEHFDANGYGFRAWRIGQCILVGEKSA